ncbi:EmmdR/YeeO family multidrug/toxin efflux MATE transporter [Anaerocolumna aminovalerica]|uniref:Probable multidrug resistance protein NorM n=1 Tax=Anaerocolumna aminovalerica TaxID=1527 RepID=A0A1I5FUY6_9FIRM|nr:MATE family efflux transporter [Anaerocolumna aminovalerica]MBU5330886.1 MATE family efflux transporter [Anaerocolumna aminovalerica]SFO27608.1 putative efflux protein, MATE family [Anaerocolumna aminovalerica]
MQINMRHKMKLLIQGSKVDLFLERQFGSMLFTYKKIFMMLIPLILDQFFINIIGLVTTAMISSSSQESVSAVSMINPLSLIIWAVFSAISVGGTVVVAQYKGSGNEAKIKDAAGQVMLATFLVAIVSCVILVGFSDVLVNRMFGAADPIVINKARGYLIGVAISQIFLSLYMGAFAVFRGMGATKICLRLTIIINVIHLLASMLFLNVMHLDIFGTTLSLNIARLIGSVVAVWILMRPKSILRIYPQNIFKIHRPILKSVFKIGIPFALEQVFFNGGSMIVQTYIVHLGTINIAANAIANSAFSILYSAGLGVGILATTIVGQCIGADDDALARYYGIKMVRLGTVFSLASIIVLFPLMPVILNLYQAPEETLSIIYRLLLIGIIPMPFFWSYSYVMPCVLRSAGDATFSSVVSLITMWVVRVGLGYIFTITLGFGVQGVWICMGFEWAVRALIFYLRYQSGVWLSKKATN